MYKSGLIIGGVALLFAIGAALLSPVCVPCLAVFLGLAAGYLAGVFDKPLNNREAVKFGAIAGTISGIGAIIGQIIGAVINFTVVGPEKAANLMRQFGVPLDSISGFEQNYWIGVVSSSCCLGILDILLMAGLGTLGGLLWWQISAKAREQPEIL